MASVCTAPDSGLALDPLSRLPVELLVRITDYLCTHDVCAVRLCSRAIERSLSHFFVHEFFRRKQFMLADFSLQGLLAMAQHPLISQTLRHVSFNFIQFEIQFRNRHTTPEQAMNFLSAVAQQNSLFHTGRAVQLLAAAFSLLPNLETVELCDHGNVRHRDGPGVPWRSYGHYRALEQFGDANNSLLVGETCDPDFESRVFPIVLAALAQSTARPPNLKVLIHSDFGGLKYSAFDLTPMSHSGVHGDITGMGTDMNLFAVLAGLRSVCFNLRFDFHSNMVQRPGRHNSWAARTNFSVPFKNAPLVLFLPIHVWLSHCPNLESLHLLFQDIFCNDNETFLRLLGFPLPGSYPLYLDSEISREVTMPFASCLRRLELVSASCRCEVLLGVLDRLPALEHLSLRHFGLKRPETSAEIPYCQWLIALHAFSADPLGSQLKHVTLERLHVFTTSHPEPRIINMYDVTINGSDSIDLVAEVNRPMSSLLTSVCIEVVKSGEREDEIEEDEDDEVEIFYRDLF